jgi:hypothetical protein
MTSVLFRHDIYIHDISVFFRHDIYIYDISVFFTWHLHSWHQCFSDMWATVMTPVLFRHDIYIHDISVFFRHDMKNTAVINIDVMWNKQMSMSCQKYADVINGYVMSEVFQKSFRHACFSDMTATFITSLFFRHDI